MNITGHDTHSIQPPLAADTSGQTRTTRQRPQTPTQRSGSLSLGELGRRTGRFIGLRQRTPQQPAAGTEQPARTVNRPHSASGAGLSALDRTGGRRFEGGAVNRVIAEIPSRQESDLEQLLADAPAEPTLAELFARSQRLQGRVLSDASGNSSGPLSERSTDDMRQPPLERAAGGHLDGGAIDRALVRGPARREESSERFFSAQSSIASDTENDQTSPNASGRVLRTESSERFFSAHTGSDFDDQPPLNRTLANEQGESSSSSADERPGWPLAGRFDDVKQLQAYTRTGRSSFSGAADIDSPPRRSNSDQPLDSRRSAEMQRWDSSASSQTSQGSSDSFPGIEHPPLNRILARRFTGIDIDRIMAYNPARQATSSLEMSLDGKGKLRVGENTPAALRQLLQNTLGQPQRSYLAHHGQPDGDQLLMDKQGNLLHLQQTPAAIAVLHSSRPCAAKQALDATLRGRVPGYALSREGDTISVTAQGEENRTRRDLDVTGRAHLAQLTGIHEDSEGQRLRLHDDRLYRFDIRSQTWTPHPDDDGVPFKQLALQADGRIYALQGDALVDMSADEPREPIEARDVRSFSVAADGIARSL